MSYESYLTFLRIRDHSEWLKKLGSHVCISKNTNGSVDFYNGYFILNEQNNASLILHDLAHAIDFYSKGNYDRLKEPNFGLKFKSEGKFNKEKAIDCESNVMAIQLHLREMLDKTCLSEEDKLFFKLRNNNDPSRIEFFKFCAENILINIIDNSAKHDKSQYSNLELHNIELLIADYYDKNNKEEILNNFYGFCEYMYG